MSDLVTVEMTDAVSQLIEQDLHLGLGPPPHGLLDEQHTIFAVDERTGILISSTGEKINLEGENRKMGFG